MLPTADAVAQRRKFKVVLMGPSLVGKTSIVLRFTHGTFSLAQDSTIGSAFFSRDMHTSSGLVTLHIWDTAGQERYKSLVPKYSRAASAIILVFDVSNPESYLKVQDIFNENAICHDTTIEWFLVANKTDLTPVVDLWNAKRYAESVHATYYETSAKIGQNVNELFASIAERLAKLPVEEPLIQPEQVTVKKCC
jgi:small GTP-binding protein